MGRRRRTNPGVRRRTATRAVRAADDAWERRRRRRRHRAESCGEGHLRSWLIANKGCASSELVRQKTQRVDAPIWLWKAAEHECDTRAPQYKQCATCFVSGLSVSVAVCSMCLRFPSGLRKFASNCVLRLPASRSPWVAHALSMRITARRVQDKVGFLKWHVTCSKTKALLMLRCMQVVSAHVATRSLPRSHCASYQGEPAVRVVSLALERQSSLG